MLKGHVFSKQIFGNQIFALFVNTFLNGKNGVSNNYKNGMQVTYSGSNVTIATGAACIQGRFLEEDISTTLSAGTSSAYCKLVIEINLDKQNTENTLNQASYKIVTSSSGYPSLTQNNIVKNVSGVYQYELARFRTGSSGISSFQDMRTFLDFDSIYDEIEEKIADIEDGSAFVPQSKFAIVTGSINLNNGEGGDFANYPSGFNMNNCVAVSVGLDVSDNGTYSYFFDNLFKLAFQAKLMNGFINVYSTAINNSGPSGDRDFIVVLMKK